MKGLAALVLVLLAIGFILEAILASAMGVRLSDVVP